MTMRDFVEIETVMAIVGVGGQNLVLVSVLVG
jgi:hypothetical protein